MNLSIVYFENHFVEEAEAKIPLTDRGFQIGDGAFSVIQIKEGVPLFLQEHLTLLEEQCRSFNLLMPHISRETVEELIERNHAFQGVWRLKIVISGGDNEERRLPERAGRVLMICKPFHVPPFKALTMEVFPIPYYCCHASFKSLSHLNRYYVMEEAHLLGVDDCITVTETGSILEASFGNLFWVEAKCVMTPDPTLPLYFGVTIQKALQLAENLGFEVKKVKMPLADVSAHASAFRTNTMQGMRPIAQIGQKSFKRNMTTESLFLQGYEEMISAERTLAPC